MLVLYRPVATCDRMLLLAVRAQRWAQTDVLAARRLVVWSVRRGDDFLHTGALVRIEDPGRRWVSVK